MQQNSQYFSEVLFLGDDFLSKLEKPNELFATAECEHMNPVASSYLFFYFDKVTSFCKNHINFLLDIRK